MTVPPDPELGWTPALQRALEASGVAGEPGRVARLDRGWSTVLYRAADMAATGGEAHGGPHRVRNIGMDVAVGDWVIDDGERVVHVLERQSAFVRRASFEGSRFEAHTLAANIDVVALVHAFGSPPNPRRLERELVLAFDSGARPVVVLTKADLADLADPADPAGPEHRAADHALAELRAVAVEVPVLVVSGLSGVGMEQVRELAHGHRTLAFLGASGVGKSTLVNHLVGRDAQATQEVRAGDQRGRHTTVAAELLRLPGGGWLLDTPGVRALSLWLSGHGIERAFADVFELMDHCRFRDCKHDREPGCAVQAAIDAGALRPERWHSLERLVAEEAALEAEQREVARRADRRR